MAVPIMEKAAPMRTTQPKTSFPGSDASAMTKYPMPGIWFTARPTTLSYSAGCASMPSLASPRVIAVFVKVFLHAVNDDFVIAPEDRHVTHG